MAKILIIDDEVMFHEIISDILSEHECLTASSYEEGLVKLAANKPDLVLMDWNLGARSGVELTQKIKSSASTAGIPVIMVTCNSSECNIVSALDKGADDHIAKPFSSAVLKARVEANLRKYHANNKPNQVFLQGFHMDRNNLTCVFKGKIIELGKKEFKILETLLKDPETVFSQDQLNELTSGKDVHVTKRSVDTFIAHIRKKLGDTNVIKTVRGHGYKFNIKHFE